MVYAGERVFFSRAEGAVRCIHQKGMLMNWDEIEGKWTQLKGRVRERWGKLTDDDLEIINGRREQLIGRLKERYGMSKEAAEDEIGVFLDSLAVREVRQSRWR